ncbi:sarcoplasmic reticulum histidine-rich calcium-binding protein-like [Pomacea canaliculata]|uniref:sarcoplasmic reticulum histidine-rich calcium-binding protein-like n=1 Tax=Pomacea canaliculata TaxID=400727 RepID=UPI000D73D8FF|nr:sarcoplasmic reticulum histidine-rich calcium-binding protein-like [Pomacea canaliculata]
MHYFQNSVILLILLTVGLFVKASDDSNDGNISEQEVGYAKGSLCGYCTYCKFCKLCDHDCPCETSQSKPNCKMCKYCKFCYLCSAFCDTICKPGSIIDTVSSAIVNALPSFNREEVDGDIESVKTWIEKKKDEL